jgi:hypothetical protein
MPCPLGAVKTREDPNFLAPGSLKIAPKIA